MLVNRDWYYRFISLREVVKSMIPAQADEIAWLKLQVAIIAYREA